MVKFIKSAAGVTVILPGETPVTVSSRADNYKDVIDALADGEIEAIKIALDVRKKIMQNADARFSLCDEGLAFRNRPLPYKIQSFIMPILEAKGDIEPLGNFLDNLYGNPSEYAVLEMLAFAHRNKLPITRQGYFLAYKRVRADYKDCYTGTLDNSVGNVVWMPRHMVDPNRWNTCSSGLHFCSKRYLGSYYGDRILVLMINPADVVAIPPDYDESKGRSWRYQVIGELETVDGTLKEEMDSFYIHDLVQFVAASRSDTAYTERSTPSEDEEEYEEEEDYEDEEEEDYEDEDYYDDEEEDDEEDDDIPDHLALIPEVLNDTNRFTKVSENSQGAMAFKPNVKVQQKVGTTILTPTDVMSIRSMLGDGLTIRSIALAHGVSERTIARIRDRETYTEI